MNDTTITTKINTLYASSGYMDKYGSDVWAAVIICIVFLLLTNYYIFANALEVIKADWPNQKCNPLILPFAGFINKPSDQSNLEFTITNFNGCINSLLKETLETAVQPLYYVVQVIQDTCNSLIDAFNQLRKLTSHLRVESANVFTKLYGGISNLMVAFMLYVIKMKDTMAKINGVLTTAIYTLFGSYMAAESLFLSIIDLLIIILIILACMFFINFYIAVGLNIIPIVGQMLAVPFAGFALNYHWVFISLSIPIIWFEIMMSRVMNLSTPPPPSISLCFAGDTFIALLATDDNKDNHKKIKDICIGDRLKNGAVVTAILQSAAEDQHLYKLYDILVTGEHRVFHPTLKWIKVKNHPDSIYIPHFNEPHVYCLGTSCKTFTIGDTLFSDWDDIDDEVLEDLLIHLPTDFTLEDIHIHLDSGFQADATVILNNGDKVAIKDVKVNDVLLSGDKVVGLVKIAAHDLKQYTFSFEKTTKTISGSQNIHIHDENLGIIHGMEYIKTNPNQCILLEELNDNMYHLLTDTKHFVINDIRVNDYNYGIDAYLRRKCITM